jgi:NAD(P)H-dependent FMN reductase
MASQLKLGVIVGSTRVGRFAPKVAEWFSSKARLREDMCVDVIDLAEAHLPDVLSAEPGPDVMMMRQRLAGADAFVIVTPEYNHSFPAPLKTAIDWHSKEWRAKPVGFVSYGGAAGGLRAVEQLRQVFAEVHAVTVRDTVSFHGVWDHFEAAGQLKNPERHGRAADLMLDQIAWWGEALREAKATRPYPG